MNRSESDPHSYKATKAELAKKASEFLGGIFFSLRISFTSSI